MSESLHHLAARCHHRTVEVPVLREEEGRKEPPAGAVLGHVAESSGAVFISDPGPSRKKKSPSGKKGLGMRNVGQLYGRNFRTVDPSKHGTSLSLRSKPSSRWCGRPVTSSEPKHLTGTSLLFSAHAHVCDGAERGLENSRRACAPFRIPGSQSCHQNAAERLGCRR